MNLREKVQSLLNSTTSTEVKTACEQFLNTTNEKELIKDDQITESLFNDLKKLEKDSLVSNLLLEQDALNKTVTDIQTEISKKAAKNLADNWNVAKHDSSMESMISRTAAKNFDDNWNALRKDKKVSNVGEHKDNTLQKVNAEKMNADKALLEKLNVIGSKDPSVASVLSRLTTTYSYGIAEAIETIKASKIATQTQMKYMLARFENALENNIAESKLAKDFMSNLYQFKWDSVVNEAYTKVSKIINEKAAELEVQNAIYDIKSTDSKRFYDQLVAKMNEWLTLEDRNVHILLKEMKGYMFNPVVKSLTNNLLLMENASGKLNVTINNSNCTIEKIFSPVIVNAAGEVFKAGSNFYVSNEAGISKLSETQVNALPKSFTDLCETFFTPGVRVIDEEVVLYVGKCKVSIGTTGTKINEKAIDPAQLGQTLMYHSQGSIFRNDRNLINTATTIQENINNIADVDYGKSIFSNVYEGVGVFMFKKSGKIYINKINPSMNENTFAKVNAVQAVNLVKKFINYNISESLIEFLDGDLRKRADMDVKLTSILNNIQIVEGEMEKIDSAISENSEIGEMPEIIGAKDLLDKELNGLKSKWNELNIEIKKFESADDSKACPECGEEPCVCVDEEPKDDKAPADDVPKDGADKDAVVIDITSDTEKVPVTDDGAPVVAPPVDGVPAVAASSEIVDLGLAGAAGAQQQTAAIQGNDHIDANATPPVIATEPTDNPEGIEVPIVPAEPTVVDAGFAGAGGDQSQTQQIPGAADVTQVQPTTASADITIPANIQTAATAQDTTQIQPTDNPAEVPAAGAPVDAQAAGAGAAPVEVPADKASADLAPADNAGTGKDDTEVAPADNAGTGKDDTEVVPEEDAEKKKSSNAGEVKEAAKVNEEFAVDQPVRLKGSDKMGKITAINSAEKKYTVLWDGGEPQECSDGEIEEVDTKADVAAADNKEKEESVKKELTEKEETPIEGDEKPDNGQKAEAPSEYVKASITIDFGPYKANDEVMICAADYTAGGEDDSIKIKDPKGEVNTVPKKYVKIEDAQPTKETSESKVDEVKSEDAVYANGGKNDKTKGKSDIVGKIMDWEDGNMSDAEEVKFFQELIDNGMAWSLQGMYGRNAQALIDAGKCHKKTGAAAKNESAPAGIFAEIVATLEKGLEDAEAKKDTQAIAQFKKEIARFKDGSHQLFGRI